MLGYIKKNFEMYCHFYQEYNENSHCEYLKYSVMLDLILHFPKMKQSYKVLFLFLNHKKGYLSNLHIY